jgi:hypothetical protein
VEVGFAQFFEATHSLLQQRIPKVEEGFDQFVEATLRVGIAPAVPAMIHKELVTTPDPTMKKMYYY